jgi:hypothetical protein
MSVSVVDIWTEVRTLAFPKKNREYYFRIFLKQSRRMRWAGHVAREIKRYVPTVFWWGNLIGRDYFEDLRVYGKMILKWIL